MALAFGRTSPRGGAGQAGDRGGRLGLSAASAAQEPARTADELERLVGQFTLA
jgi:hypothetical protein